MLDFIQKFKSVIIGTLSDNGYPFSSYAPFVYDNNRYYVLISDIAQHAQNLRRCAKASLFFIEDETAAENLFARKRVSLQCDAAIIDREQTQYSEVITQFKNKFAPEMIDRLTQMQDFNLFAFTPIAGEAVFGFGEAYTLSGAQMNQLTLRRGRGHQKK